MSVPPSGVIRPFELALFAPTMFFLVLAVVLPLLGMTAFTPATAAALAAA
jgi:hypothetical protein